MTEAEFIASQFHAVYEQQAPHFGYETRPDSAVAWENVPDKNKRLMIRVVATLLVNRIIDLGPRGAEAWAEGTISDGQSRRLENATPPQPADQAIGAESS